MKINYDNVAMVAFFLPVTVVLGFYAAEISLMMIPMLFAGAITGYQIAEIFADERPDFTNLQDHHFINAILSWHIGA